jgi:hypothetical protein
LALLKIQAATTRKAWDRAFGRAKKSGEARRDWVVLLEKARNSGADGEFTAKRI